MVEPKEGFPIYKGPPWHSADDFDVADQDIRAARISQQRDYYNTMMLQASAAATSPVLRPYGPALATITRWLPLMVEESVVFALIMYRRKAELWKDVPKDVFLVILHYICGTEDEDSEYPNTAHDVRWEQKEWDLDLVDISKREVRHILRFERPRKLESAFEMALMKLPFELRTRIMSMGELVETLTVLLEEVFDTNYNTNEKWIGLWYGGPERCNAKDHQECKQIRRGPRKCYIPLFGVLANVTTSRPQSAVCDYCKKVLRRGFQLNYEGEAFEFFKWLTLKHPEALNILPLGEPLRPRKLARLNGPESESDSV